eukprot:XP_006592195.2 uncharacterized protein LOC100815586 [Glycine max]
MLMEEDLEAKPCMFHDSLALQAAEKSFYEVIGETYPSSSSSSSIQNYHNVDSPDESSFSGTTTSTGNSFGSQWNNVDLADYKPSILQTTFPTDFVFQASSIQSSMNTTSKFAVTNSEFLASSAAGFLGPGSTNLFSKSESVLQFERGVEEANKFLPKGNPLVIDLENPSFRMVPLQQEEIKAERDIDEISAESRGRKNHEREDEETDLQDGRSNKQSAVYIDDSEISELLDKVLLGTWCRNEPAPSCIGYTDLPSGPSLGKLEETNKSGGGKSRVKKQGNKKGVVDLRTLLILCAQAVSSDDHVSANELLKQIKQHASPLGDGTQRLAHCFANALEARLAGTGTQIYTALSHKRTSAADMVKAYQMYISACPFKKLSMIFANHTILQLAKEVETLHIIDFGIRYGFQWPAFIYRLSKQPGGPPKLRITGIELPQPGFRPAERVQETGLRLARYCDRFNVPFEFNAIAQKWETIKIEDLKIKENELLVANAMFRFQNLLDETVVVNSPRDAVLKLIRKANPAIFLHATVNGSYNAPFFVTRFREALFHYSTLFDVLDTNVAREDPMRLMFEREFFGRQVMNIVACEGSERVERPETYKQWQVRNMRAGFKQLPLDKHLINKLRCKLKGVYHSDFMLLEDGNYMLQGWKGRVVYASSCWVPAYSFGGFPIIDPSSLEDNNDFSETAKFIMIMKAAAKAETVHVIDFGILYGFQWPNLVKFLSDREGGPPKLRITGIEFPNMAFAPQKELRKRVATWLTILRGIVPLALADHLSLEIFQHVAMVKLVLLVILFDVLKDQVPYLEIPLPTMLVSLNSHPILSSKQMGLQLSQNFIPLQKILLDSFHFHFPLYYLNNLRWLSPIYSFKRTHSRGPMQCNLTNVSSQPSCFVFLNRIKSCFSVTMESNFPGAYHLFGEDQGIPYLSDSLGFPTMDPSSPEDNDFSETVKFISQILMEENVDQRPFYDSLTLRVTEKSFYDALTGNQPPFVLCSEAETNTITSNNSGSNFLNENSRELNIPSPLSVSVSAIHFNPNPLSQPLPSVTVSDRVSVLDSSIAKLLAQNISIEVDSVSKFRRGLEEATKFLPPEPKLVTGLDLYREQAINSSGDTSYRLNSRKNHGCEVRDTREEEEEEGGRSNKQSALSLVDETDLSDAFDQVLLHEENLWNEHTCLQSEAEKVEGPNGGKGGSDKKVRKKKKTVDLRNLLLMCSQAVYASDIRAANELLKQIRQHSSPIGDASQRLAHYFANGLEARLVGDGTSTQGMYTFLSSKNNTFSELLKAYQVFSSSSPFKKFAYLFENTMIMKAAASAETVHIIDFGILHGFQWPMLIRLLSNREGGPPKLRITGIEFPQPGFRPTEKIEETGRHLANYCKRYNVPFEYNAISSRNWETIQLEALKIASNELVAVYCHQRFENLLDECTIEVNSPRNAVLHLIRKINPDIFTHSITNGSYNAPFFTTRFREALFHFSTIYDLCDTVIPRENEWRMLIEREVLGREAMNVIACEGSERVERPETYKQWQARNMKAGFKQLPLNEELLAKFRNELRKSYHRDFVLDEDKNWMLQGWKGRILYASTCWVPACTNMLSTDSLLENFPGSVNGFIFENGPVSVFSNQNPASGFEVDDSVSPSESATDSGPSSGASSNREHVESTKHSNPILRYISDILMDEEDDLERKPCMLQDCLRLQAAEKSFYDALVRSYPSSPRQFDDNPDQDDNFGGTTSSESFSSYTTDNSCESDWFNGASDFDSSFIQRSLIYSPEHAYVAPDPFRETQAGVHFSNGAWNLIHPQNKPRVIEDGVMQGSVTATGLREKRSYLMNDMSHEEERSNKLSSVYSDDSEPSSMFDEVLLCKDGKSPSIFYAGREPSPSQIADSGGSNGKKTRSKRGSNKGTRASVTTVDLWTLLIQCAQAVASFDQRTANETLKQIRQHSSPFGDGLQRLAHYFADGLEKRLAAGTPKFISFQSASAADMLKAYRVYISASPFLRMSNFLANRTILKLAQNESSLHIIDFGISYGFQWPCLIQRLSERPGGPPKLLMTGIDLPQPGFRPAERVEETGRWLEKYCKRFGVPFEYNCLAQKWETIRLEDLKIDRSEVTVVNCLYRLKNLSDETVTANCPRDALLRLIRRINPNIFMHGVVNGTYNAPFFVTRFREALFHFSSLFDMFEVNVPREDPSRLMIEKGVFGRDAINVIACEGAERVERPETYKQWQVRNQRAGFKQLPLAPEHVNRVKEMVKKEHHKDFVVDEDGKWVLQGWKGRILFAVSSWVPA